MYTYQNDFLSPLLVNNNYLVTVFAPRVIVITMKSELIFLLIPREKYYYQYKLLFYWKPNSFLVSINSHNIIIE